VSVKNRMEQATEILSLMYELPLRKLRARKSQLRSPLLNRT